MTLIVGSRKVINDSSSSCFTRVDRVDLARRLHVVILQTFFLSGNAVKLWHLESSIFEWYLQDMLWFGFKMKFIGDDEFYHIMCNVHNNSYNLSYCYRLLNAQARVIGTCNLESCPIQTNSTCRSSQRANTWLKVVTQYLKKRYHQIILLSPSDKVQVALWPISLSAFILQLEMRC